MAKVILFFLAVIKNFRDEIPIIGTKFGKSIVQNLVQNLSEIFCEILYETLCKNLHEISCEINCQRIVARTLRKNRKRAARSVLVGILRFSNIHFTRPCLQRDP